MIKEKQTNNDILNECYLRAANSISIPQKNWFNSIFNNKYKAYLEWNNKVKEQVIIDLEVNFKKQIRNVIEETAARYTEENKNLKKEIKDLKLALIEKDEECKHKIMNTQVQCELQCNGLRRLLEEEKLKSTQRCNRIIWEIIESQVQQAKTLKHNLSIVKDNNYDSNPALSSPQHINNNDKVILTPPTTTPNDSQIISPNTIEATCEELSAMVTDLKSVLAQKQEQSNRFMIEIQDLREQLQDEQTQSSQRLSYMEETFNSQIEKIEKMTKENKALKKMYTTLLEKDRNFIVDDVARHRYALQQTREILKREKENSKIVCINSSRQKLHLESQVFSLQEQLFLSEKQNNECQENLKCIEKDVLKLQLEYNKLKQELLESEQACQKISSQEDTRCQ